MTETHNTNATFGRLLGKMNVFVGKELSEVAYGMWNPQFCAADPSYIAKQFITDMRGQLDHMEKQLIVTPPTD